MINQFWFSMSCFSPHDTSLIINLVVNFQVTKSVISLLNYYGWRQFSIIYEEKWEKVAESLTDQAKTHNKTINHKKQVVDRHKCCVNNMECCRPDYWYDVSTTQSLYYKREWILLSWEWKINFQHTQSLTCAFCAFFAHFSHSLTCDQVVIFT